jgi:hypothetical protein
MEEGVEEVRTYIGGVDDGPCLITVRGVWCYCMFESATWLRFYKSVKTPVRIAVNYNKMRNDFILDLGRGIHAHPLFSSSRLYMTFVSQTRSECLK